MSQHATELCTLIVRDTFGELGSRIFATLCSFGRLPIHSIQLHSGLRYGQVRHGLALLIQQNVVSWHCQHDEVAYYEANLTNAYTHLQFGKQLELVQARFGSLAAVIVSEVHLAGRCLVQDLSAASTLLDDEAGAKEHGETIRMNGTTTHTSAQDQSQMAVLAVVTRLIEAKVLIVCHEAHIRSRIDNWHEAEQIARERHGLSGALKGQDKLKIEESMKIILEEWWLGTPKTRAEATHSISTSFASGNSRKRRQSGDGPTEQDERPKRRQLNNGDVQFNRQASGPDPSSSPASGEHILLVNHEKLRVIVRNQLLVSHVGRTITHTTALIYAKALSKLEDTVSSLPKPTSESQETDDDAAEGEDLVTTQEVVARMDEKVSLLDSIAPTNAALFNDDQLPRPWKRRKKVGEEDETEVQGHDDSDTGPTESDGANGTNVRMNNDASGDESRLPVASNGASHHNAPHNPRDAELVRQHLLLLAEHPSRFIVHHARNASAPEAWSIHFGSLTDRLRLAAIMDIIALRYSSAALRLANILNEKGKLDEKALSSLSLLNQKIMRSSLASMHNDGLLELQEVPRDNNRMPAKTIFLWFFEPRRAAARLLNESYKAMSRVLQRVGWERDAFKGVLDKASRSDVVGREGELLTKAELSSLKKWRATEARLVGELARLDDLVMLLRDE